MADTKISAMTAATAATASTVPVVQGGVNKKLSMTGAGASMIEAADAAAQRTLLTCPGLAVANIFSVNGTASTPAILLDGSIFTGGSASTTQPAFLIQPSGTSWANGNTEGTAFGINTPTGFLGDAIALKNNGGIPFFRVFFDNSSGAIFFGTSGSGAVFYGGNLYPEATDGLGLGRPGVSSWNNLSLTSAAQVKWNSDAGLTRSGAAALKVTDAGSGYGTIDAAGYNVNGTVGYSGTFGTSGGTTVTVINGIITANA